MAVIRAQAALAKGAALEDFSYEPEELGPSDVEIEISHCGLCHSDLHLIDDSWSQAHAVTLVDFRGKHNIGLLTGKRYMTHNGHDPGEREPLGVYWYERVMAPGGRLEWAKHVLDYGGRTGGGIQIPVADIDGDGDLDFVVAGKSGLFLFENKTK